MDQDALRQQIAKLHGELDQAHRNYPAARERLSELLPQTATSDPSLPDRLEQVAVQFEADHPTLAASARRLIDLLGEVGI